VEAPVETMTGMMRAVYSRATSNRARKHLTAVLVAAALLTIVNRSQAAGAGGVVFSDGFESGNTNLWSADGFRNKCTASRTAVDGGGPHSGSYMAECNWNGILAWNDPAAYTTLQLSWWNYSREFLIRFWVRLSSDVDHKIGSKLLRLFSPSGSDNMFLDAQMESGGGPIYIQWAQINGQLGPILYGSAPLGNGSWHKVEIYLKHNTPGLTDGTMRVWQDGVVQHQAVNITSVTTGNHWYPMYFMSNWSNNPGWEHDANNHVYWDDVEVFSDLGTGATGLMSDATIRASGTGTPTTPQNLRIVR
jgi:hypothetical protein